MFGWFQRLLPHSGDFYVLFERHSASLVGAAEALVSLTSGEGDRAAHLRTIRDKEHAADEVIRETLHEVRQTFLAPFDRGAITSLIGSMDDTIDEMNKTASAIELFEVGTFDPQMAQISKLVLDASRLIAEAMPQLRDIERNGRRLHELTARLVKLEGEVDVLHDTGMKAVFQAQKKGKADPLGFMVSREIYKHLERIADAFEDVANEIDSLVIDHG
jgi:predicted phosphate transport protein (TIGR00153 family)